MLRQSRKERLAFLWLKTAVILLMFALAFTSIQNKSPTFDEQGYITRGVGYLRGENRHMRIGHPLGLNALNGIFLAFDQQVDLPIDDPSWQETSFHRPSELFMWEIGNDVRRVMLLGRLPTIFLGLLLAALTGRWAWRLTGSYISGLLALTLVAFDPNILAHMRLTTTDFGFAVAALLAGFTLWRFWQKPSWASAILAGVAFGLLQSTKFTAGLFALLFILMTLAALFAYRKDIDDSDAQQESQGISWRPLLYLLFGFPLAAFITLWATYGFQIGILPDDLPTFPQLGGLTLPLSHHVEQLLDLGGRIQKATPSFLLGDYSDDGWWYYFPVALIFKTPLPILIFIFWAFALFARCLLRRSKRAKCLTFLDAVFILIPPLGYFAIAVTSDINLGYRHLLPILPFLYVFIAVMVKRQSRIVIGFLASLILIVAILAYPHYLPYFNLLAGGQDGGWRYLVDSNMDWGQDLEGLSTWMDENQVERIWLSYFGEARPEYYGINYDGLDSFPPRLMNPKTKPFYPYDPAPGTYAISATNLQGVHFADHEEFAIFREREPTDKVGFSIFIYDIEPNGPTIDLALGSMQLEEIVPSDYAFLGTNDVVPHWFDAGQSLLIPGGDSTWLIMGNESPMNNVLNDLFTSLDLISETPEYRFYRIPSAAESPGSSGTDFYKDAGRITLTESIWRKDSLAAGETLNLQTKWSKLASPQPIKIFIHMTDMKGNIIAQWDGLGASWEGWREGDLLVQAHELSVPQNISEDSYQLWTGLYDPETGIRWQLESGDDRLLLGEVQIREP